jgi:hypothetical protein
VAEKFFVKSLFLPLVLLLVSFGFATTKITKESVTVITDDQTKLTGIYYRALTPNAPGVILLPDTQCDKKHFGDFPSFSGGGFSGGGSDQGKYLIMKT